MKPAAERRWMWCCATTRTRVRSGTCSAAGARAATAAAASSSCWQWAGKKPPMRSSSWQALNPLSALPVLQGNLVFKALACVLQGIGLSTVDVLLRPHA